jgi:hypothetical protein
MHVRVSLPDFTTVSVSLFFFEFFHVALVETSLARVSVANLVPISLSCCEIPCQS